MRFSFVLAFVLFISVGCEGMSKSHPVPGASSYSLGGKEIIPPNQVEVQNPYPFSVKVEWPDGEMVLPAHGSHAIIFKGMNKPGSIRVWELDAAGSTKGELIYDTVVRAFRSGTIYRVQ